MVGGSGWMIEEGIGSFKGSCGFGWWGSEACIGRLYVLWDIVMWDVGLPCVVD
jgi:hypothetical protein